MLRNAALALLIASALTACGGDSLSSQTISFGTAPANLTVNGTATISATASSGLPVTVTSTTASICTVSGTTVTGVAAGSCVLSAAQAGDSKYSPATAVTQSFNVSKAAQTLTFGTAPAGLTVGGTATVSATATSSLAASFSSQTASVCSVSGTTVTGLTAGNCTIAADQAGNATYAAATQVTQSFTVSKVAQTIAFGSAPALSVGRTGTVSATATSSLAVAFSSLTASVCTVTGTTVTGVSAGTCTIAADQLGDATYAAATQATQNITVLTAIAAASQATATATDLGTLTADASGRTAFGAVMFMGDSGYIWVDTASPAATFVLEIRSSDFLKPAPIRISGTFQKSGDNYVSNTATVQGTLLTSITGLSVSFSLNRDTGSALGVITWTDTSVSPSVVRSSQFTASNYGPKLTPAGNLSATTGAALNGLYNFAGHITQYARSLSTGLATTALGTNAVVGTFYVNGTAVTACREGIYNPNTSACGSGTTRTYTLAYDASLAAIVLMHPGVNGIPERGGTVQIQAGDNGPVIMIDLSENTFSGGVATGNADVGVMIGRKAVALASGDANGTWKDTKTGEIAVVSGTSITLTPAPSGTNGTFTFLLNRAILGGALGGGGGPGATAANEPGVFSSIDPTSGYMVFQGMALSSSMVGIVKGDGTFHAYIRQ